MATIENLQAAFAGESQANRKYLAFAKKAEADKMPQVAKLFRAAAGAETIHAHAHLRAMGGVKSTAENLKAAVEGEGYEFQTMYPQFIKESDSENNQAAGISFRNAMAVEQVHHGLYQEALAAVEQGKDLPSATIYLCTICGNTVVGNAPDKCPVCGASQAKFSAVK
ncbi:MAG: rubrerythrin [Lentisphaerae bacterium RIFOXYA12_FULL_48_11]|nr:MAG: rubrerythrin [Lentisphaerae bacterium RIFOXYA12_FULL_48_11]